MRRWVLVLGVGLVVLGGMAVFLPGVVQVGEPDAIIAITGIIAIVAGATIAHRGYRDPRSESEAPAVEDRRALPAPGDEVDELVGYASPPNRFFRERRQLRQRTHELSLDVLGTFDGLSEDEAAEAISSGMWTDDVEAARFFGAIEDDLTWRTNVRRHVFGPPPFRHRLSRTLDAIGAHLPGFEDGSEPDRGRSLPRLAAPAAGVTVLSGKRGETGHWRGVSLVAMAAVGIGILTEIAPLFLGGVVGVGYVAYSRLGAPPDIDLSVSREVTPADPAPAESVTVRVSVENRGGWLVDLRLIDGVPSALAVEDGTPRRSVALQPGASTTFSYTVAAVTGTHTWEPLVAIARSINGSYERRRDFDVDTSLSTKPASERIRQRIPLRTQGATTVGELPSSRAGEGIEFQSVREYRPGDRRTRIDWRRYARFGDLTTVEFREEQATTVVISVDARERAYRASDANSPMAVEIGVEAADRLAISLMMAGHRVGLASLAPDPCWLAPQADRAQQARIRELLATHPSMDHDPPDREVRVLSWVDWFRARAPGDSQLLLLTPLCDDLIVELLIRIETTGHPVTIISPDLTSNGTLGGQLVGMERAVRIAHLRRRGITVVDWSPDQPLDAELMRLAGRWP